MDLVLLFWLPIMVWLNVQPVIAAMRRSAWIASAVIGSVLVAMHATFFVFISNAQFYDAIGITLFYVVAALLAPLLIWKIVRGAFGPVHHV